MAENLDDGEFWLPPQFLTDDDILMDFTKSNNSKVNNKNREADSGLLFPGDYSSGFGSFGPYYSSDLSSPVESVVSSTETESDEEDYLAGLTRKLAQSSLLDDLLKSDSGFVYENQKAWAMSGSPQSTLTSFMGGYNGYKEGSSRGSPNGPSLSTSPPQAAPLNRSDASWNLLYAAAGEVARMRMTAANEGFGGYYQKDGLFYPPRIPSPVAKTSNQGFQSNHNKSLSYQQLQVAQFQQLKQQQQQQMMKQQQQGSTIWGQPEVNPQMVQNRARNCGARPLGLSPAAWPTLQQSQQQPPPKGGSGMRALFLGNSTGAKRECAGTGVFLPRRVGSPTETRKKPAGCSTVLLPDRVVQALNLNLEAMDAQPQLHQSQFNRTLTPDYDAAAALKYRNNVLMAQQRRNVRAQVAGMNQELRLPSEWSY